LFNFREGDAADWLVDEQLRELDELKQLKREESGMENKGDHSE